MANELRSQNLPEVTVVTTVLNGENEIEKTIQSVINQDYKKLEYIIVDAASTDNTLKIVNKYKNEVSSIISEPDKGDYDGMNKGANNAAGEWIIFLHCGDVFYDKSVLTRIFKSVDHSDADIIYGNSIADYDDAGIHTIKVNNKLPFWKRYISHQSVLIRTKVQKENPYKTELSPCADYELLVKLWYSEHNFIYTDTIISLRSGRGYSDNNRMIAAKTNFRIIKKYVPLTAATTFYLKNLAEIFIKEIVKKILPNYFQRRIRRSLCL